MGTETEEKTAICLVLEALSQLAPKQHDPDENSQ